MSKTLIKLLINFWGISGLIFAGNSQTMKLIASFLSLTFSLSLILLLPGCARSQSNSSSGGDDKRPLAPELTPNLGWINTTQPLTLHNDFRGRVVLLDFWTYGCINCMHIIPDLQYLEKKYADQPFSVIGVHSAKFDNEQDLKKIKSAVKRYNIHHPVVVDDDMAIWDKYGVQAWPTFILIDSTGHIIGHASGEGQRQILDAAIAQNLPQSGNGVAPVESQVNQFVQVADMTTTTALAFPGKVLASTSTSQLYIADTNHNRVIITSLPDPVTGEAELIGTIGTGKQGHADGSFNTASLNWPQGLALNPHTNTLYIADTNNHLIRAADLNTSIVKTIAGTGQQGYDRHGGAIGTEQAISSPWALEYDLARNKLYIAMAGLHQIWTYDPGTHITKVFAGSGRENLTDGSVGEAAFAQPSGLALMNGQLYVADSEASAIRAVDIGTGNVKTVIGQGLFTFGDTDGHGSGVRLQHPLGVAADPPNIVIADTYNHKIKQLNPMTRTVKTLYGTGNPGKKTPSGKPAFYEPSGLSIANNHLYIADTNNHRIIIIDQKTQDWTILKIQNP